MIKTFRKLHLWLSVPFGLIVTLICFSGAMLVFESEIPQITISDGNASVALGNYGNVRASDNYKFDSQNGSINKVITYSDSDKANKLSGWISAVHMGSWGGIFTKIIWMLAALLGASLPLTGYYIWINSLSKKKRN